MNRRTAKVVQLSDSLAVILPKDWTRGMGVSRGDKVDLFYNGFIRIYAPKPVTKPPPKENPPDPTDFKGPLSSKP